MERPLQGVRMWAGQICASVSAFNSRAPPRLTRKRGFASAVVTRVSAFVPYSVLMLSVHVPDLGAHCRALVYWAVDWGPVLANSLEIPFKRGFCFQIVCPHCRSGGPGSRACIFGPFLLEAASLVSVARNALFLAPLSRAGSSAAPCWGRLALRVAHRASPPCVVCSRVLRAPSFAAAVINRLMAVFSWGDSRGPSLGALFSCALSRLAAGFASLARL